MKFSNLLDPELGARLRALLTVTLTLITAVVAVLQGVVDVLDVLPKWQGIASVSLFLQGAVVYLGRFTTVGNKP